MLDLNKFEQATGLWWKYVKPFFESEKGWEIYQELKKQSREGEIITPKSTDTWKFLKNTNPDNVKVIIIGMDSYPGRYFNKEFHATGIPLDCSNSPDGKLQPSLLEFWNGISNEYGEEVEKTPNLQFLLDQGVFFGNRALTCKLFKTGSHMGLWDPFWEVFFENYVSQRIDIPIIFLGKDAAKLKRYVTFNTFFEITHPSSAARSGTIWSTNGVFKKVNQIIRANNGPVFEIIWDYKTYKKRLEDVPF